MSLSHWLSLFFVLTHLLPLNGQDWESGTLTLKNGKKRSGIFRLDETHPEGTIFEKLDGDSLKIMAWPAFKIEYLQFSDRTVEPIWTKLGEMRKEKLILVERIFDGSYYQVIRRRLPERQAVVKTGVLSSTRASLLKYQTFYFIKNHKGEIHEIIESSLSEYREINARELMYALDVNNKALKQFAKQENLKLKNPDHLPKIISYAEKLIRENE